MASSSDPTSEAFTPDASHQALLEIGRDGAILWAAPEAHAWWGASTEKPLVGRPLASLFAELLGLPPEAAWANLLGQAQSGPRRLTAHAPAGAFSATVQLTAKGEPDGRGFDNFIAAIERLDLAPAADPATTASTASPPTSEPPPPARAPEDDYTLDLDALAGELDDDDPIDELGLPALDEETDEETGIAASSPAGSEAPLIPPTLPALERLRTAALAPEPAAASPAEIAGARIGVFHIDLIAGTARYSDTWKDLLGYEPDDVADEPDALATLVHPDDSEASPLALHHPGPFSAEIRLRTKDDAWRWMQLEGVRTDDTEGIPGRIDGIMLDAQERHDADEQTAQNEQRFLRLTGRGTAGFFELDLLADTAGYSPEFRRVLGRRSDELGTTPDGFLKVLPPEDAEVGVAAFFQSITSGLPALVTRYQLTHADGRLIEFDAFLTVRRSRRGVIEHICGLQAPAGDTAPAARADSAEPAAPATSGLASAIQHALDAASEPILLIDPQGLILHANLRAAALAGASPDSIATRPIHEVFPFVLRTTGAPAPEVIDRVLGGAQAIELDQSCSLLTREGAEEIAITCRPVLDERRRLAGATVVLRRLAELPLSQAEMVKSNRMEALGRLACGIVHDFNNLLTTVVGGVSLAVDKRDLAPLETALKACNNAKNLARQLLTFARGDVSGRRVQSLNDIIRETARMAGAGSRTTVELELSADLHPVNVVTSQIVQVFTNLILNAMQVMPTGGRIWVRTLNMPLGQVNSVDLPAGEYVRADVQDNGPGIPPENLARIFEPFFTTRAEGTGLGLAMVNSIVAQHEGAIEAASTVGSGTTFTLYFPRAQTEAVQETPQKLSMSYGSGRILLMDDDPDLCAIASGMLDMLGYQADTATTADEAITKFRKSREFNRAYAAVVLDLTMAGGPGGEDVVARLREIDPAVKAIVSSGYATDENAEHYRKLGFTGILSKPYRSGDLGRVLKEVLGPPK